MTDVVRTRLRIILLTSAMLAMSGCGGIEVNRMVPEATNVAGQRFEQSLKIVEPIGGQKSKFGVQDYVENPEMHGVLMGAFQNANMFSRVTDSGSADLERTRAQLQSAVDRLLRRP